MKRFLIEMVMRWVEEKRGVRLDHQFKLPKMRYKGLVIQSQTIRSDRYCSPGEPSCPQLRIPAPMHEVSRGSRSV